MFFNQNRTIVCVQGLGFVGAAMSIAISAAKDITGSAIYNVIGVDRDDAAGNEKVNKINDGIFPFETNDENLLSALKESHKIGNLIATTDKTVYSLADIIVIDINLDVYYREDGSPYLDLSLFKSAMEDIGRQIKEGTLIVVETTVPPGTCEKVVSPILKNEMRKRGLDENKIYISHSYERVMPGSDYFDSIVNYWRVYSGINEESAKRCESFLRNVISTDKYPLTKLNNTTSTEMAKVLENSFRSVTIAFMEEWGRFAEEVGVDLFDVINAIRMRPTHNNMRQPGFGVGGYCLTKDPYFAKLAAKELYGFDGMDFPFSTLAVQTNRIMPLVTLNKMEKIMGTVKGKRILVLGVSYRQDVGDTRYSPTEIFAKEAKRRGANLDFQDPLVEYWHEMKTEVKHDLPDIYDYDAVLFCVPHKEYKMLHFSEHNFPKEILVFDANNVLDEGQRKELDDIDKVQSSYIGRG